MHSSIVEKCIVSAGDYEIICKSLYLCQGFLNDHFAFLLFLIYDSKNRKNMNVFWNVISPINVSETQRFIGEVESSALNTAIEVLFRKMFGLKANWIETFLACKLSLHFDGGVRGAFGMDDYTRGESFEKTLYSSLVAGFSEGVEARSVLRSFDKGFHIPYYGWEELVCVILGRFGSEFILSLANEKIPAALKTSLDVSVAAINRAAAAQKLMMAKE